MNVEKGDRWYFQISGIEQAVVQKILDHQADVHAFYFERNHKWWLSFANEPAISFDEANQTLHLSFNSIFEYSPDQM
jgi:hypothetical protein